MTKLHADDNDIGPAGLSAILSSPALANLEELSLSTNRLGPTATFGPNTRRLVVLRCAHDRLGDAGVVSLANAARDALRTLDLRGNGIGARGLEALSGAPFFGGLDTLDLSENPLGPIAGALLERVSASRLVLDRTHLGVDGVTALAAGSARPTVLSLRGCGIGDEGCFALADSPLLSRVKNLDLADNGISIAGVRALARSLHIGSLEVLSVGGAAYDDVIIEELVSARHLKRLDVDHSKIGDRAREALRRVPPSCCP
jgi:Ran GTPase-activating protein (RanGAP) involved in mRNA processing and transport